jgi:putative alpha-1,2-mannosidase
MTRIPGIAEGEAEMSKTVRLAATLVSGLAFSFTLSQAGCGGGGSANPDAAVGLADAAPPGTPDAAPPGTPDAAPPGTPDAGPQPLADRVQHVRPFIGTDDSDSPFPVSGGAGGSTYPGAVVPFGMVQLSPDTPTGSPSGYRYSDTQIEHFSLTHFDGAGCPNNEDLPFLPTVGALTSSPASNWASFRTGYAKETESASPGYYHVTLAHDIEVELTATTRTGLVRFHYPANARSNVLLHTGRSATGVRAGQVEIVGPDKIRGSATAGGFCGASGTFTIFFAAQFDRPYSASGTWLGTLLSPGSTQASGSGSGGFLTFDTTTNPVVQMKIGISFVSIANAEANLAAENPGFDFDGVRAAASTAWNQVLNRIEIDGGSAPELQNFYTAMYHVFQSPNVANDVNGEYMGFDGDVHTATGWTVYQNYSGWDIIRSWMHLVAAIAPEAPDIVHSMVEDGVQGGLLPFWTHQNVETNVMVGDPGTVNVANAYAMGVRGFDTDAALALMIKSATDPNNTQRWGLADWIDLHYAGNAAMSLEYAMADFAISQYAGALGNTTTRDQYLARSHQWVESWNPDDKLIEPRVASPGPGAQAARIYEVQVFGTAAPATNLALDHTATASASCGPGEGPEKAVNGTVNGGNGDKWCDNTSAAKWWQVDLGSEKELSKIVLFHANAGGEGAEWNTKDFTLSVSSDGNAWHLVATVTGNTADSTTHNLTPITARYVKLEIQTAIQTASPGAWDCQPIDDASQCGFVEGNAALYVWMVPHDLEGVFTRMGGHAEAVSRLDDLFTELNAGTDRAHFYIGNEPEHGTPWTYNFTQTPWKTQALVRRIINEEFTLSPGGLPGNDDLGATSAWLVWAYLGMYPVIPGNDALVIHGPQFGKAVVHLANGKNVTIEGEGAGPTSSFVQSLAIDGTATTKTWLRFADIANGATLHFVMGAAANQAWGAGEADRPPSFAP